MELGDLLIVTFIAALVTDLATGVGAIPFFFVPRVTPRLGASLTAASAGMMTCASVVQLLGEAFRLSPGVDAWRVGAGLALGAVFFILTARWVHANPDFDIGGLRKRGGTPALLVVLGMTIHSLPEGIAIGVAYGESAVSGTTTFGFAIALALAIHNVPEGLAISAALRGSDVSPWSCVGWSVFSSIPQPLAAVPAAWAVWLFQPLLPAGLGFAAGAMLVLVATELIPEVLEHASKRLASVGFAIGFAIMLGLTQLLASG